MAAKPIPDGYHTVTPYLTVRGATKVIDFLKQAFGAKLSHEAIKRPDGSIMHAQVLIGDSRIMICEESEMAKATTSTLYLSRSRRGQRVPAGGEGRRANHHGAFGHVLRRPQRRRERSVRQQLVHRNAQGRRWRSGTAKTRRGFHQAAEKPGRLTGSVFADSVWSRRCVLAAAL